MTAVTPTPRPLFVCCCPGHKTPPSTLQPPALWCPCSVPSLWPRAWCYRPCLSGEWVWVGLRGKWGREQLLSLDRESGNQAVNTEAGQIIPNRAVHRSPSRVHPLCMLTISSPLSPSNLDVLSTFFHLFSPCLFFSSFPSPASLPLIHPSSRTTDLYNHKVPLTTCPSRRPTQGHHPRAQPLPKW